MTRFNFSVTLLACIAVEADTRGEAEHKLREALTGSDANLGMLEGEPIVTSTEIEGALDLIDDEENAEGCRTVSIAAADVSQTDHLLFVGPHSVGAA
jgi:hypothetical protein